MTICVLWLEEGENMRLTNLRVLSLENPLGIDTKPYFSWMLESKVPNTMQHSYRLTVTDECGMLCWDTGVLLSDRNTFLPYSGEALKSRTRYNWTVTVTDNHGSEASASAYFETALLEHQDWVAQWARSPYRKKKGKPGFGNQSPATMFRQGFVLRDTPVRVRMYATCHGIYELYINGARPDQRRFAPEHTSYGQYLCYQTYDITDLCTKGENAVGLYVGDGWYISPQSLPNIKHMDYAHAVLFQIDVTYADGSCQQICSGAQTKAAYGPVHFSDLYVGQFTKTRCICRS